MDVNKLLAATGLFVVEEEEPNPSHVMVTEVSPSSFVNLDTNKKYEEVVLDTLCQKILGVNPVAVKFFESMELLESVPFPDDELRVKAALASAKLTATEVLKTFQTDFVVVLKHEKDVFKSEIDKAYDESDKTYNSKTSQLTARKQQLESELLQIKNDLTNAEQEKRSAENKLNEKIKGFDSACKELETQLTNTISILTQLK